MKNTTALAILLVAVGLGSMVTVFSYFAYTVRPTYGPQQYSFPGDQPNQQGFSGAYSYWGMGPGMMQNVVTTTGEPIAIQEAIGAMRSSTSEGRVIAANDTVIFGSQSINIVALALMPDKARSLTGMKAPNYSTDDVFVISGLINPTLVVPAGATIHFTIVNLDDDMYHNLVVSPYGPPYPYMAMQGMMWGGGMPFLPPADYAQGIAREYSYSLTLTQPGLLWYLCTYPGHAQSGMYGQIEVYS